MPDSKTTVTVEAPANPDAGPDVIAYRVGRLEQAVDKGFKEHNDKLDSMVNNFTSLARTVEVEQRVGKLETSVGSLLSTNHRQQGSIDAGRRNLAIALTVLGILVTGLSIYYGVHK